MTEHATTIPPAEPVRAPGRGGPLSGALGLAVVVVLLSIAGYTTWQMFTNPPAEELMLQQRDFICAKTLKHFRYQSQPGERYPVYSPHSKEHTGYPAEKCYWTKDGQVKADPDYVLLNNFVNKPGATTCPVCGRLVEPHNPLPPLHKLEAARKGDVAKAPH